MMVFSCFSGRENVLEIKFSSDSTAIIFNVSDEVNLFWAKEQIDTLAGELISVIEIADEYAGSEKHIEGKIMVKGNSLVFMPKTPFVKGSQYLVSAIFSSSFGKTTDVLRSDVGKTIKRQEKILER